MFVTEKSVVNFSKIIADHEMLVASAEVASLLSVLDKLADFKMILRYVVIVIAITISVTKTS